MSDEERRNSDVSPAALVRMLGEVARLHGQLREELTTIREGMDELRPRLRDLDWLVKVIRDGNGQPPLMYRVSSLEEKVLAAENHEASRKQLKLTGTWQLRIAVVTGIFSLLLALVNFVNNLLTHGTGVPGPGK